MGKSENIVFLWYISIVTFVTYAHSGCVISLDTSTKNKCNTSMLPSTEVCGTSTEDQIIGGDEADLYDFPWVAILKYRVNGTKDAYDCGGVLINERYIVTAANCVIRVSDYKLISARLGEHNLSTEKDCTDKVEGFKVCADLPVDVGIEQIIVHPNHRRVSIIDDIALVRLAQKVNFTDFIKPICLPIGPELFRKTFEGETHHVTGFGITEDDKKSNVKLKIPVQVLSNHKCAEYFPNLIKPGHICARRKNRDTCKGEAGSPLMKQIVIAGSANWYCTGIASFGPIRCGQYPGGYVRITKYVEWILYNMNP